VARPAKKSAQQGRGGGKGGGGGTAAKKGGGHKGGGAAVLTGPPLGTYDPALDYQLRASQRGLADLIETTRKENQRSRIDYRTGRRLNRRQLGRDLYDLRTSFAQGEQDLGLEREALGTSFTRDLTDLAQARQRGEEDYNRTLANLQREYAAQAFTQSQNAVSQGVDRGGGVEASQQVRTANQEWDRGAIDTEHARSLQDLATTEGRTTADYETNLRALDLSMSRLAQSFDVSRRRTRQNFGAEKRLDRRKLRRGLADSHEKLSRAKREQGLYEPSVIQQEYFQAHQYNPKIRFPRPAALGGTRSPRRGRRSGSGGTTAGHR
jgi:hypothetical protein